MITKNLDKFKITTTKQAITSFAGLPLLLGMAKNLGLEEQINALPLKERARAGICVGEFITPAGERFYGAQRQVAAKETVQLGT